VGIADSWPVPGVRSQELQRQLRSEEERADGHINGKARAHYLDNGDVMYYGRCLMSIYPGSEHVRGAEFRVPALKGTNPTPAEGQSAPVVNATVYPLDNNVGTMFAIYNINHNILGRIPDRRQRQQH
jgi:hypothetical protein